MKMHCCFLLNIKHGASQLYFGGGLQLSSAGTGKRHSTEAALLYIITISLTLDLGSQAILACDAFVRTNRRAIP